VRNLLALAALVLCCTAVTSRSDAGQIRALRLENNHATLERNVAALRKPWKATIHLIEGDGSSWTGAAELAESYASAEFKDPNFVQYVRIPINISISADGLRAAELGNWTAINKLPGRNRTGTYLASWQKVDGNWKIVYEAYVRGNVARKCDTSGH
jgi:hypothetical protein